MSAIEPGSATQLAEVTPTLPRSRGVMRVVVAAAAVWLVAVVVMAIFGYQLAPQNPHAIFLIDQSLPPGHGHLLGTDALGRDVLSRVIAGTRTAVAGPALLALCTAFASAALGILAGYRGGWIDTVISRGADLMYALPALLVIIVVVGVLGGGYLLAVLVLTIFVIPADIRLIRSATLAQRELPYVESARILGLSPARVMTIHVLPNILPTLAATVMLEFVAAIVTISGLSFLGLGVQAGTPDWGLMVAENRDIMTVNAWAVLGPAGAISLTALAATVCGDWLYDKVSQRGGA